MGCTRHRRGVSAALAQCAVFVCSDGALSLRTSLAGAAAAAGVTPAKDTTVRPHRAPSLFAFPNVTRKKKMTLTSSFYTEKQMLVVAVIVFGADTMPC